MSTPYWSSPMAKPLISLGVLPLCVSLRPLATRPIGPVSNASAGGDMVIVCGTSAYSSDSPAYGREPPTPRPCLAGRRRLHAPQQVQHFVEVKLKVNHLRNSYGETYLQIRLLQTRLLQISRIAANRIAANKIATNKIVKKISPGLRGRRHAWPSRPLRRSFLLRIQPEVPIHCAVAELSDSIHPSQPGPPTR